MLGRNMKSEINDQTFIKIPGNSNQFWAWVKVKDSESSNFLVVKQFILGTETVPSPAAPSIMIMKQKMPIAGSDAMETPGKQQDYPLAI